MKNEIESEIERARRLPPPPRENHGTFHQRHSDMVRRLETLQLLPPSPEPPTRSTLCGVLEGVGYVLVMLLLMALVGVLWMQR